MSNTEPVGLDLTSARIFNHRKSETMPWKDGFSTEMLAAFPGLAESPDSEKFVLAVYEVQKSLFPNTEEDWDGKLGRGTWTAMLKRFDPVEEVENYIIYDGRRIKLPENRSYEVICYDQPGGLDLHRENDYLRGRKHGKKPNMICWHWGSSSAQRLYNIFANAEFNSQGMIIDDPREVSSHGCIELKDGKVRVYQFLDFVHRAWHGSAANNWSIGLDICQQPTKNWYSRLKSRGWDVDLVANPTDRGDVEIVTLEPRLVQGVRELTEDICKALDIPLEIPRGPNGLATTGTPFFGVFANGVLRSRKFSGIIGHHHVVKTKWDIAPWWEQIFGDLY